MKTNRVLVLLTNKRKPRLLAIDLMGRRR